MVFRRAIALLIALFCTGPFVCLAQSLATPLVPHSVAERSGMARAWSTQLPIDPARTKIKHITIQSGIILVVSEDSMLYAVEPETGLVAWSVQIGDAKRATLPPAANEKFVVAVNGTSLFIVDRAVGNIVLEQRIGGTPDAAPAVCESHVIVPIMRGPLEVHDLERQKEGVTLMHYLPGVGRMIGRPNALGSMVLWAGDRGRLDAHQFADFGINFTERVPGEISTGPVAFTPHAYIGNKAGYLLAYDLRLGHMVWEFTAGSPIYHPPVAQGEVVYVLPQDGGMFAVDAKTGGELWFTSDPVQFVSASPDRIYALDKLNRLVIVDAKTGARVDTMLLPTGVKALSNVGSDRAFLYSKDGLLQMIREAQRIEPHYYIPEKIGVKRPEGAPADMGSPFESPESPETPDMGSPFETPETPATPDMGSPFEAGG